MKKTWTPSTWGKAFTGSGDWSLTIDEDDLNLRVGGNRYNASIVEKSPLSINHGVFWTDISLHRPHGESIKVDGIPNAHGEEISTAIFKVVERKQTVARRREQERQSVTLRKQLSAALEKIIEWHQVVMADIVRHNKERRWITSKTIAGHTASRPEVSLTGHEMLDLLGQDDIKLALGAKHKVALIATRMWAVDLADQIKARNERFTQDELVACKKLFDTVESRPLTEEQARAAICFDNRILVVASAGSGKTSTMVAKAAYAIHRKLVVPERIVMLAFNDAAAKELKARIRKSLDAVGLNGAEVSTSTFHKLGSDIIGEASGRKKRVPSWLKSNAEQVKKLLEIVDALKDQSLSFRTSWDLFRLVFSRDISSFGKSAAHEDFDKNDGWKTGFRTLNGELVNSLEERTIADWLFYNGVQYQYEPAYAVDTADRSHSQYRPDFFYPGIGLYHEHFALNAAGHPPAEFEGYLDGVAWKRELHSKHKTPLFETTSAQMWDGSLFIRLTEELTRRGVTLDPNPDRSIPGRPAFENKDLATLIRSFICHAKSNCLSNEGLAARVSQSSSDVFKFRHYIFLDLYKALRKGWDEALAADDSIDFEDMLNLASEHLENGDYDTPYDLVMVDEFQDTSWSRARMVLGMITNPSRVLFAVGDDWQSINRFAGADISVMTGFEDWSGNAQLLRLEETFRCPQELCDISSMFVVKNPKQMSKSVRSRVAPRGAVIEVYRVPEWDQTAGAIDSYLERLRQSLADAYHSHQGVKKATVLILGRYNRDEQFVPAKWEDRYCDLLSVRFSTVHSAKGTEADFIILPNVSRKGFPSIRQDDPVLRLAMPAEDSYPHSEERRLFYVALTRARRSVAIFTVERRESPFVLELIQDHAIKVLDTGGEPSHAVTCNVCNSGILIRRDGPYGTFYSCVNFPFCKNKMDHLPGATSVTRGRATPQAGAEHGTDSKKGAPWSLAEEAELTEAYRAGASFEALAAKHRRTSGAIRARLGKLGLWVPVKDV